MDEVLTVDEVAAFLRTDSKTVTQLLDSGQLTGFRLNNEWRVLAPALIQFLGDKTQHEQQRIMLRELSDPKAWARELRKDPQFASEIQESDFSDGTMGASLKQGLADLGAEERADNVVDIRNPKTD